MNKPGFLPGLKRLAELGLELDSANPNPDLIHAITKVSDRIPDLRIVIDHLPSSPIPTAAPARKGVLVAASPSESKPECLHQAFGNSSAS